MKYRGKHITSKSGTPYHFSMFQPNTKSQETLLYTHPFPQ